MEARSNFRDCNKDVVLDIESELAFWKNSYGSSVFHSQARRFEAHVATLKFGYDMYLLNHRRGLDELMPALQRRYLLDVPKYGQLEWPLAEAVVRETWKRMQPDRPTAQGHDAAASGARAF